jgi:hypothetical protein
LIVTDEELPPYDPGSGPANPPQQAPTMAARGSETGAGSSREVRPPQPGPDEPPPDYVEAQSQAIGMRFEERMREDADRQ